jgi:hypothetical protein
MATHTGLSAEPDHWLGQQAARQRWICSGYKPFCQHTNVPAFNVDRASAPVDLLVELQWEEGRFILDVDNAIDRAHNYMPAAQHFDLWSDIPDGSGRRLFAQAENCPAGRSSVDLNMLPPWLERR